MKKLAVLFPGIGYTCDRPLLYYARKIAENKEYEVKSLTYAGFPAKVFGNLENMKKSLHMALEQTREMLADVDFSQYDEIVFIAKSVGTIVSAIYAEESEYKDKIRLVLYTPLEYTFDHKYGKAIAFTGDNDPWVGSENSKIPEICENMGIKCLVYKGANHSLETGDMETDIGYIRDIMQKTEEFL